jgi:MFS family permease
MLAEAIAAVLMALSWNAPSLILFWILGGAVGAAAAPTSMALIMEVFPVRERVRAMGWWSFVGAGAPVLGVVAGGPIIEHFSWRTIFVVQVPLCAIAVVFGALLLPARRPRGRPRFDLRGSVLITITVSSLLLAVNRSSLWGWGSPFVLVCL